MTRASRKMRWRKALASLGIATVVGATGFVSSTAAVAEPALGTEGCGYGQGGPHADTICWIDMSRFDADQATTPNGQQMEIKLGAYTMSFTAKLNPGLDGLTALNATSFPTFGRSVIGNANNADAAPYYLNTPGKPALYQASWLAPEGGKSYARGEISLDNIVVKDPSGATFAGDYSLILADAESTGYSEGFSYSSDSPIRELARLTPTNYAEPCVGELSGIGTTEVTCVGGDSGGNTYRGALVVAAEKPTHVKAAFLNGGSQSGSTRQGVAFGVMASRLSVTKIVESRYNDGDDFIVTASESGDTIATASTAGGKSQASSGAVSILSKIGGKTITFEEKAISAETNWSHYDARWSCDVNGVAIDSSLLTVTANGRKMTAPLGVGDFLECSVTNTAKMGAVTWTKVDSSGAELAGSTWELTREGEPARTVVDNGPLDQDSADGRFLISGLKWGSYTLRETEAPTGHSLSLQTYPFTIGADARDVKIGAIENARALGEISWRKVDPSGDLLAGSEWELVSESGQSQAVIDNGPADQDPTVGGFRLTELAWGNYTLKETRAPQGHLLAEQSIPITIGAKNLVTTIGDISNQRLTGEISWEKVDAANEKLLLAGSKWTLTGPDGSTAEIEDNGLNDSNPGVGLLKATGLKWGTYKLTEVQAPSGYLIGSDPIVVEVNADHIQIALAPIPNEKMVPGLSILKKASPESGSKVKPGEDITYTVTVKNTGNIPLTPARISDDLSDVLDNATFQEGSETAQINGEEAERPTVDLQKSRLNWEGTLPVEAQATISYRVTVNLDVTAEDRIVNLVTGSAGVPPTVVPPTSNCDSTETKHPDCTTEHMPVVPTKPITPATDSASLPRTGGSPAPLWMGLAGTAALAIGFVFVARSRKSTQKNSVN